MKKLLEILIDEPDCACLMIDANHCKVHPHAGEQGGQSGNGPHKRGLNSKSRLLVNVYGMPFRAMRTQATAADWKQALALIDGLSVRHPLADRGSDNNAILCQAAAQRMVLVILPKKNRKERREYDKELYKTRQLVEKAFLHLKRWREELRADIRSIPHRFWPQSLSDLFPFALQAPEETSEQMHCL